MKKPPHAPMCSLRLFHGWTWLLLVPLFAGCPKSAWEVVCVPTGIFEVLEPERGAGAAPFSVELLGAKMEGALDEPTSITFTSDNRALICWQSFGHMYSESNVIYSPSEGLARSPKYPTEVYPVRRFSDGKTEQVRLGYYSKVCRQPDTETSDSPCKYSEERVPLVADMTCRRQRAESP
jgi:hypothetical protein